MPQELFSRMHINDYDHQVPPSLNTSDIHITHHHQQQRKTTPLPLPISTPSQMYTHLLQELRFEKILNHVIDIDFLEKRNKQKSNVLGLAAQTFSVKLASGQIIEKCIPPTKVQAQIDRLGIKLRKSEDRVRKVREQVAWLRVQVSMDLRPGVLPMELWTIVKEWVVVYGERDEEEWSPSFRCGPRPSPESIRSGTHRNQSWDRRKWREVMEELLLGWRK